VDKRSAGFSKVLAKTDELIVQVSSAAGKPAPFVWVQRTWTTCYTVVSHLLAYSSLFYLFFGFFLFFCRCSLSQLQTKITGRTQGEIA